MILTERHIINKFNTNWKQLDNLCFLSKNLYNQAIFVIKQEYSLTKKIIRYNQLEKILKNKEEQFNDYYKLPPATSQQILMLVDKNIKSFFSLLKKWKRDKNSLTNCPKFPKFKDKIKGRNIVIFRGDCVRLKQGKILLPKRINFQPIQTNITGKINQVRIIPQCSCYVIEIVYEKQEKEKIVSFNKAAIDLGINNLCALTLNFEAPSVLINGKPLKSINQFFNKKKAKIQSDLKTKYNKYSSNYLNKLFLKRNNKISDYLHKSSRFIVNCLKEKNVSELIVGYNKKWKQNINIGKKNNQNFVNLPHYKLLQMLSYKCELEGIEVKTIEESYTSKCSSLDWEPIQKHEEYMGKRTKRGLFVSKEGKLLNADINGSLNIGRKVLGDAYISNMPTHIGFVMNPMKIKIS